MKRKNQEPTTSNKKQSTLDGFVSSSLHKEPNQQEPSQIQSNSQDVSVPSINKHSEKLLMEEADWIESLFNIQKEGFEQIQSKDLHPSTRNTTSRPTSQYGNIRGTVDGLERLMKQYIPDQFWELLLDVLNDNLTKQRTTGKSSSNDRYYGDIKLQQLFLFLGTIVHLENVHSKLNSCAKDNLQELRESNSEVPGYRRFFALTSSFAPSDKQLNSLTVVINDLFIYAIVIGSDCVCDETVYSYQISSSVKEEAELLQQPIPVVYIPRKPHPNGLMSYKICVSFPGCKKPYIVALLPQVKVPFISPEDSMIQLLKTIRKHVVHPLHITGDAAFGSYKVFNELEALNVVGTFSMPTNEKPWIWNMLKRCLKHGNWKSLYYSPQCLLLSMQRNPNYRNENDKKYHYLISNAFDVESTPISLPTISNTTAKYSSSFLNGKTVEKLKEIGRKEHIKLGKMNKDEIIQKIQFICNSTDVRDEQLQVLHNLDDNQFEPAAAIHHNHYRSTFNLIDVQDKYHYKARYAYAISNWRSKMMISLLNDVFYNLFPIINESERIKYKEFRSLLSQTLLNMGSRQKIN